MSSAGRGMDPAYRLYRWFWHSLDWIYPPSCAGCGHGGERWCQACQEQVKVIHHPLCHVCGRPLSTSTPQPCTECQNDPPPYTALRSWAGFSGTLREALHRLKYRRNLALGEDLSIPLIALLRDLPWKPDAVVPVPLSKARLRQRGYNQVHFLARPVALNMGIPFHPKAIAKIRETASQVGLSRTERKKNIAEAFLANSKIVGGMSILLIDDVTTSGATINACTRALLQAGAKKRLRPHAGPVHHRTCRIMIELAYNCVTKKLRPVECFEISVG